MKLRSRDLEAIRALLPARMVSGLVLYIEDGIPPGDFLCAVIQNDLKEACARADDENRHLLWDYVNVLYNHAPSSCWGSEKQFNHWVAEHQKHRTKGEPDEARL